ncbi:MAG: DsbA family protein [Nitrososphaeraceae archaeon]|nr:DsbA family protein [Nitrososphaeraceae archaeon]
MFSPLIHKSFAQWTIPTMIDSLNNQNLRFLLYDNTESNLTIHYPSKWTYKENSANEVEFHPPNRDGNEFIKLSVNTIDSNFTTIKSIVDATLKDKSKQLENFELYESTMIPNPLQNEMQKLVYSYTNSNNTKVKQLDVGMIDNNKLYLISLTSNPINYYEYISLVEPMISSLTNNIQQKSLSKYSTDLLNPVSEHIKPIGNENANITVVEFADYRCPFCHKFHTETFDKIKTNFIDNGNIKYLFRDFVVNDKGEYKGSTQAAIASHCAAEQGRYWEYSKEIYDNFKPEPQQWINIDSLVTFANNIQIPDIDKFKNCIESSKYQNIIVENSAIADELGLTGTPAFVVLKDDEIETIIPGALPYEEFEKNFKNLL